MSVSVAEACSMAPTAIFRLLFVPHGNALTKSSFRQVWIFTLFIMTILIKKRISSTVRNEAKSYMALERNFKWKMLFWRRTKKASNHILKRVISIWLFVLHFHYLLPIIYISWVSQLSIRPIYHSINKNFWGQQSVDVPVFNHIYYRLFNNS